MNDKQAGVWFWFFAGIILLMVAVTMVIANYIGKPLEPWFYACLGVMNIMTGLVRAIYIMELKKDEY